MNDSHTGGAVLELLNTLSGVPSNRVKAELGRVKRREWAVSDAAQERVRRADGLANALKRGQRQVKVLHDEWLWTQRNASMRSGAARVYDEFFEMQRAVKRGHAELRELLCGDEELISQVKAEAGLK